MYSRDHINIAIVELYKNVPLALLPITRVRGVANLRQFIW